MKITDVIRGEEWISSLPKHVTIYNAFNWKLPQFCHLPLLLNEDKSKLSKGQGDVSVDDFIDKVQTLRKKKNWIKQDIIDLFFNLLPDFAHKETGKYLDQRM